MVGANKLHGITRKHSTPKPEIPAQKERQNTSPSREPALARGTVAAHEASRHKHARLRMRIPGKPAGSQGRYRHLIDGNFRKSGALYGPQRVRSHIMWTPTKTTPTIRKSHIQRPKRPHQHKDPTKHDFSYPPCIGPWNQNVRSLYSNTMYYIPPAMYYIICAT